HVLLTKRDPSASIGWIGLAWLSPIVGCILYLLLGINRVKRRAYRLRRRLPPRMVSPKNPRLGGREDQLGPLEAAVGRITDRLPEAGNAVT
uniref:PLD nuclease N-terminal domain-containing protein n=1 Tax=Mammaliicoccus sciuri TaxID=1296 RepID=UPI002896B0B2